MELTFTKKLIMVECSECHMDFGVTPEFDEAKRNSHKTFYCPSGHRLFFPGRSDKEELQNELNFQKSRNAHLSEQNDHYKRSSASYKGKLNRTKKRISNGVCPCCNRHFKNVERHITTQHPNYRDKSDE